MATKETELVPHGKLVSMFSQTHDVKAYHRVAQELTAKLEDSSAYIRALEQLLEKHNIPLPDRENFIMLAKKSSSSLIKKSIFVGILKSANEADLRQLLEKISKLVRQIEVTVSYRNYSVSTMAGKTQIPTVASAIHDLFLGSGPKTKVALLENLTGRLCPGRFTLLLGPPGSGKSLFLKAFCGRLNRKLSEEGDIFFNRENIKTTGMFLIPKVTEYIEQEDTHAATLTVEETLTYAWMSTTGGHHSYAAAANDEAAQILEKSDEIKALIQNNIKILGLDGCKSTFVGDATIRGVSGGQKKRVTVGEMLVTPRHVKFMDSISNGLDSATTYDIVRTCRDVTHILKTSGCISLLQPPPEVFDLFDDIILMSEGQIVYQGPRDQVLSYFSNIGYKCPPNMDVADFLQVVPTPEGKRFFMEGFTVENGVPQDSTVPRGTKGLVEAWKKSDLFAKMVEEMDADLGISQSNNEDLEKGSLKVTPRGVTDEKWPDDLRHPYPGSFWFHFKLTFDRQVLLTIRDADFLIARVGQNIVIGAIAGSLFSNIETTDITTMNGFLFFTTLFGALAGFEMIPIVYAQKAVYYKHSAAMFYPTSALTLSQAMVFFPLHAVETIVFTLIMYWSAGLSDDHNGSRFLTFILLVFTFSVAITQVFRTVSFALPSEDMAAPIAGVLIVLMVLFSGFILPKNQISNGWIWFYYLNPISWVLKAVTINEFKSPKYDFMVPSGEDSNGNPIFQRFGDLALESYGNPTEEVWIWYSFAVLIAEYIALFILSTLILKYVRSEVSPPPPIHIADEDLDKESKTVEHKELPFEPIAFSFTDIWYTVKNKEGEELDLLRGVSGFFEPGTVTALMGSSGAGKTTLLDVLSGRKNTGTIKGNMYLNGHLKDEHHFRRIMGYVEQFDSLSPHDTAREAIEFSAALRLPSDISAADRQNWVETVLDMLELIPIENMMVGTSDSGGMSFEQKKRVSIAVELAANPSILFLDEPTTGLDSRAAQIVSRSIRRVAASGRSIVCTIHQPSYPIFSNFDSLLLLKRGGQTVFFGQLGENCENLINYFQSAPGVEPIKPYQNPATWMLEVIGAGTAAVESAIDFHAFYSESESCATNDLHTQELSTADENENNLAEKHEEHKFQTSLWHQFKWVLYKMSLSYWRTPSYNFSRMIISIIVALIFASAYPNQTYSTDTSTIARSAVIYITCLFCGVIGLNTVMAVAIADRPSFYREQQSEMYSVAIYTFVTMIVEIPYLMISSLLFTLPFYYIVGFHNVGVGGGKFLYYWLFQGLYTATLVFFGQFFIAFSSTKQAADVFSGIASTFISIFCGFMIKQNDIPTFWLFAYWLNPLHYALEGLFSTQFHGDKTPVLLTIGTVGKTGTYTTADNFILNYYDGWSYDHVGLDILALFLFILVLQVATYFCLSYLRHDKR